MPYLKTLRTGSNTPIVFLHGFLGSHRDWEPVIQYLSPFTCIALDLPGHGNTPFEPFEIPLPYFHLVGYSMGGRIAMDYAQKHPEKIASLHLISAHPGLKTDREKKERRIDDENWAKKLKQLPIDEFLTQWYDQAVFNAFVPDLTMRKKQNVSELAEALLYFSLSKQQRFETQGLIVGEHDPKFHSLAPNPTIIPNAGHMVHLENPKMLASTLQRRISCA